MRLPFKNATALQRPALKRQFYDIVKDMLRLNGQMKKLHVLESVSDIEKGYRNISKSQIS